AAIDGDRRLLGGRPHRAALGRGARGDAGRLHGILHDPGAGSAGL
ncbi:MAG: hypothetical protein AVDCRST_MAG59-2070, partial [uncultured Thermomicrobiales bacterium]